MDYRWRFTNTGRRNPRKHVPMVAQIHRRNVDIVKLSSRHASRRQLLAKAARAASRVGVPGRRWWRLRWPRGRRLRWPWRQHERDSSEYGRPGGWRATEPSYAFWALWQRMLPIARRSSPFNGPTVFAHACRELT